MKKLINLITFIVIAFICLSTIVFATDINMNLSASVEDNSNLSNQTITDENEVYDDEYTLTENSDEYSQQSTTVSSVSSVAEGTFGLSQILNIFLIVVGIVLILLGIALLIRLK